MASKRIYQLRIKFLLYGNSNKGMGIKKKLLKACEMKCTHYSCENSIRPTVRLVCIRRLCMQLRNGVNMVLHDLHY